MKAWIPPAEFPVDEGCAEGVLYSPPRGAAGSRRHARRSRHVRDRLPPVQDILAKYNPGVEGQEFATGSAAKFIAAGSDIVFEVHYTATRQAGEGPIVSRHRPRRRAAQAASPDDDRRSAHAISRFPQGARLRSQGRDDRQRAAKARLGFSRTCTIARRTTS
jgi:hypothetical protein